MESRTTSWISPTRLTLVFLVASALVISQAQTFRVLHTFHGRNGSDPVGPVVRDIDGSIYGATGVGGTGKCSTGCGTVFKLNEVGKQVWLYSFKGRNASVTVTGVHRDKAGNLYGAAQEGGTINQTCPLGCGFVFKLDKNLRETVLHKFSGTPDGYYPIGPLVEDSAGNLYGTTQSGGTSGLGSVFKVDKTGKETVLYSFTGGSDGCAPDAGLTMDTSGNLYGVTIQGGNGFCNSGYGVAFKLNTTGKETVLHTFGGADGAYPSSVLLLDSVGNFYGVTEAGGTSIACGGGCGTVFEMSHSGRYTVLYSFCSLNNSCDDGEGPTGKLARDSSGNLYGTAYFGGKSTHCNGTCGVAFKLDTTGKETVIHNFRGGTDGGSPESGLVIDNVGNLYGTTFEGGDDNCDPGVAPGCGVVFEITP